MSPATYASFSLFLLLLYLQIFTEIHARKHHLLLKNDVRRFFKVSSFGYTLGGYLEISVQDFSFEPFQVKDKFGFTLTQMMSDSLSPYLEGHERGCYLTQHADNDDTVGLISLVIDFEKEQVITSCSPRLIDISLTAIPTDHRPVSRDRRAAVSSDKLLILSPQPSSLPTVNGTVLHAVSQQNKTQAAAPDFHPEAPALPNAPEVAKVDQPAVVAENSDGNSDHRKDEKNDSENGTDQDPGDLREDLPAHAGGNDKPSDGREGQDDADDEPAASSSCRSTSSLQLSKRKDGEKMVYSFGFRLLITREEHIGLYSVFFHSCPNYDKINDPLWALTRTNLSLKISEKNTESYLSAGEIPLPELHFFLSVVFFILGCLWVQVLRSKRHETFKLHYLMALLVFVKSAALLFHGINFHFISTSGSQIETWAVLYYITHLLKGALLFITIVLIGTGWAFVKHILSEKDKQLFMIVIPLQVLANIAEIITEESEEGDLYHNKWREIFILVDLLCCGAILFPVVWSIRHLQEAAHVDGKAAMNLKKLKLFRRFYVIIVCYIYFTRIIVYLLKITLPFQYEWMDVLCQHVAILVFFILTGYHFQPTPQNPYFRVSQDDDLEMEEVLFEVTPNTYNENLHKKKKKTTTTTTGRDILAVDVDDDRHQLISKRESSHDFD